MQENNQSNKKWKRCITHTDFDGVISAFLLTVVFKDIDEIIFKEPVDIQHKIFVPKQTDIVCDLPKGGGLWFDHHPGQNCEGKKECHYDSKAPSAARIIFETYKDKLKEYEHLVIEADKIDTASFTKEEYNNPNFLQKISIAIRTNDRESDDDFRTYLINSLSFKSIKEMEEDSIIIKRYEAKAKEIEEGDKFVKKILEIKEKCIVVDLVPHGEDIKRWAIHRLYLDYPECDCVISATKSKHEDTVRFSVGNNIFNKKRLDFDIGNLMRRLGGGGHFGVGGATVPLDIYKDTMNIIVNEITKVEK